MHYIFTIRNNVYFLLIFIVPFFIYGAEVTKSYDSLKLLFPISLSTGYAEFTDPYEAPVDCVFADEGGIYLKRINSMTLILDGKTTLQDSIKHRELSFLFDAAYQLPKSDDLFAYSSKNPIKLAKKDGFSKYYPHMKTLFTKFYEMLDEIYGNELKILGFKENEIEEIIWANDRYRSYLYPNEQENIKNIYKKYVEEGVFNPQMLRGYIGSIYEENKYLDVVTIFENNFEKIKKFNLIDEDLRVSINLYLYSLSKLSLISIKKLTPILELVSSKEINQSEYEQLFLKLLYSQLFSSPEYLKYIEAILSKTTLPQQEFNYMNYKLDDKSLETLKTIIDEVFKARETDAKKL
jgi:hypothetical protein